AMPSSIERSAPADSASLPEVMTTPFTAASAEVCLMISSSSPIEVSSSTFIERPGMSQVTSAMPSASVSTLKFLKVLDVIWCFLECRLPDWALRLALNRTMGKRKLRLPTGYLHRHCVRPVNAHAASFTLQTSAKKFIPAKAE